MSRLQGEIDPADAGFDAGRLARLDDHFRRYVDDGTLKGWLLTISRHGKLAHAARYGHRDAEAGLPVTGDTLWRIYSMTKPITSVAAMMLYEEGAYELTDPVSKLIPAFKRMRVFTGGSDQRPVTVPATEPVRIWHLLTHTAGLTYPGEGRHPVDAMYLAAGFRGNRPHLPLDESCDRWARLPLLFEPGTAWNYSVATDVLGHVIEVASGQRLDEFLAERVFGPLGMSDTGFSVPAENQGRLAALYTQGPDGKPAPHEDIGHEVRTPPAYLSGGGGLVSAAADYDRFMSMLLPLPGSPAGELDGTRLLSPRTVALMGRNHLPGHQDLARFTWGAPAGSPASGLGFGLGLGVVLDPVPGRYVRSAGELSWSGAASTAFWIDPTEELSVGFYTQLLDGTHSIHPQLRQLVYQALL